MERFLDGYLRRMPIRIPKAPRLPSSDSPRARPPSRACGAQAILVWESRAATRRIANWHDAGRDSGIALCTTPAPGPTPAAVALGFGAGPPPAIRRCEGVTGQPGAGAKVVACRYSEPSVLQDLSALIGPRCGATGTGIQC